MPRPLLDGLWLLFIQDSFCSSFVSWAVIVSIDFSTEITKITLAFEPGDGAIVKGS
uniref:Uncharacterized protein n=1 Tax=Anguilla anguilla TaxID=7936 RepID=A0A0E9R1I2_ANGAN